MKTILQTIICAAFASSALTGVAQSTLPNGDNTCKDQKECCVGDTLYYYGTRHGSVGTEYMLKLDETAFDVKVSSAYDNPEKSQMPGGDRQNLTYKVICKKQGTFLIREIVFTRSDISIKAEHTIIVKQK